MKPVNFFKSLNLFWAASLFLLILWIEIAKAGEPGAEVQAEFLSPPFATTDRSLVREGQGTRVALDLLLHYSEQDILDALRGDSPNGTIFMRYEDDAVVRAARLALAN